MAAVARNRAIGNAGGIPWRLPDDLRRFKRLTMGHVLVMGRQTYESIGRPLPGRTTVVVTRQLGWPGGPIPQGVLVADGYRAALDRAASAAGDVGPVFVQGGAQIYAAALAADGPGHRATRLAMTWVDAEPAADTYFPDVDWDQWVEVNREPFQGGVWVDYDRVDTTS